MLVEGWGSKENTECLDVILDGIIKGFGADDSQYIPEALEYSHQLKLMVE